MLKALKPEVWCSAVFITLAGMTTSVSASADDAASCSRQTDEIMAELRQLRTLIENQGKQLAIKNRVQAETASITVGKAPRLGSEKAPLTIVEFTDFQCPYCNRFFCRDISTGKK